MTPELTLALAELADAIIDHHTVRVPAARGFVREASQYGMTPHGASDALEYVSSSLPLTSAT